MHPFHEEQLSIEHAAIEAGIARFRTRDAKAIQQGRPEDRASVNRLLKEAIEPAAAILQGVIDASADKPGRHHAVVPYLKHLTPDQCAFLTGRALFHSLLRRGGRCRLQAACLAVGRSVITEALASEFREKFPRDYASAFKKAQKSSSGRRARTVLLFLAHKSGVAEQTWPEQLVYSVGMALIDAFCEGTGLMEISQSNESTSLGFINEICMTAACAEWLSKSDAVLELARPVNTPMVCPPRPWQAPYGGGYLMPEMRAGCAIHTNVQGFKADLRNHWDSFKGHFETVNKLQTVPWKVNARLLAVASKLWAEGGGVTDNLPTKTPEALPPQPKDIATNEESRKAWRKQAAKVYERECARVSNCVSAGRILQLASDFSRFPEVFFPMYADFRGRLYTLATDLTPQGCDMAKGLLDFADGAPIENDIDVFWMAVNGANLYGVDKVSLDERVAWTEANSAAIREAARDPLGCMDFWLAADKPWQFLAWAFEWNELMTHGYGTMSYRRVDLDGSCNGLQHFAALLRDAKTGKAVNLVPAEKPNDIYQLCADRLVDRCLQRRVADADKPLADGWAEWGIDRKMTKRPVMVLPYGGTIASTRQYIYSAYRDGVRKQGKPDLWPDRKELNAAVNFLAAMLWEVLEEVLPAAINAMKWLQSVASSCSKAKLPVVWTSPSGFIVHQAYEALEEYRVSLFTPVSIFKKRHERKVSLLGPRDVPKLAARQQRQGIAPNFVHSLDAAHLVDLVKRAWAADINSVAVVHDSYGCLAPQCEEFAQLIRDSFAAMHSVDLLENLRREVAEGLDEGTLSVPPLTGDLDINQIKESDYAFA